MGGKRKRNLRIGTRGSRLALWQAERARALLRRALPEADVRIVTVKTSGDHDRETPLAELGGAGAFVRELERVLLAGEVDLAVHSAKDMPAEMPEGLVVAATPRRGAVEDALVCREALGWRDLPAKATLGTSSPRRAAQAKRLRPDLVIRDIRGNVETRLRKVDEGEYDATLLARAGLQRLGLAWRIDHVFPPSEIMPAPGQGIVALQCREEEADLVRALRPLTHGPTHAMLAAERAFLRVLRAGCSAAVGVATSHYGGEGMLMRARVLSLDGAGMIDAEETISGEEVPERLGEKTAESLLRQGAGELLEEK